MSKIFSNQATPKYLGYVYQVLIALEQCFDAKPNQTIWIECKGDIYDGNVGTETKHHTTAKNLTNNDPDFWNTLKNWIAEDIGEFGSFVLHTTANIADGAIFYNWNNLTAKEKKQKLSQHTPSEGVKTDYEFIFSSKNSDKLMFVLSNLSIKSSQLTVEKKIEELEAHSALALINDAYRHDAIDWAYGYINRQAIHSTNTGYQWHIKRNDFFSAWRAVCSSWVGDKTVFENTMPNEVDTTQRGFVFIEEMQKIGLRESSVHLAVTDYLLAQQSHIKMLMRAPTKMTNILEQYDQTVLDVQANTKNKYSYQTNTSDINAATAFSVARDCYFNITEQTVTNIPQVSDTPSYYPKGRMHHNVNDQKFVWRFTEDDFK